MESEISGLADLHAFMKYGNYVTGFSFPYLDVPRPGVIRAARMPKTTSCLRPAEPHATGTTSARLRMCDLDRDPSRQPTRAAPVESRQTTAEEELAASYRPDAGGHRRAKTEPDDDVNAETTTTSFHFDRA